MSSILAVLEPDDSNYMYFVSDTKNKVYFSVTEKEFDKIISELKDADMWPEY